jgi:bifunctional non-homologous end joining protein LigD
MKAPSGEQWVHEIKHDGYRLLARKVDGRVRLYTTQGYDWSKKYPLIVEALYRLRATSVVLDGDHVLHQRHARLRQALEQLL